MQDKTLQDWIGHLVLVLKIIWPWTLMGLLLLYWGYKEREFMEGEETQKEDKK